MYYNLINSMKRVSASSYPSSLKLFVDAGNPLSYSGSGTTVTDLIGTQNGTLTNGVGYSSSNGGCFTFDGVNDYITFGTNTTIQPISSRTVSVWVYIDTSKPVCSIFSDGNLSTDRNGINIWHDSGGGYRTETASASSYQLVTISFDSLGTWWHITYSFNGSFIKTYMNGVLKTTTVQTIIPTNGVNPTLLGNYNTGTYFLKGNISQLKIYNTQLSDAEVLTDFNEFKSRYGY